MAITEFIRQCTDKRRHSLLQNLLISEIADAPISLTNAEDEKDVLRFKLARKRYQFQCPDCGADACGPKPICHDCDYNCSDISEIAYEPTVVRPLSKILRAMHPDIRINFEQDTDELSHKDIADSSKPIVHVLLSSREREFSCLQKHEDHVLIGWPGFIEAILSKRFAQNIIEYIRDTKRRQLDWTKIDKDEFVLMVKDLLKAQGHTRVQPGGSGPDEGKDVLSWAKRTKYVTQCRHTAKPVGSTNVQVLDTVRQHNAGGYIIACPQGVTGPLSTRLGQFQHGKNAVKTEIWDGVFLMELLIQNNNLRHKYFSRLSE